MLARPDQDAAEALARLADELARPTRRDPRSRPARPSRRVASSRPESVAATLAALMPEQAVIADESVTFGRGFFPFTYAAAAA